MENNTSEGETSESVSEELEHPWPYLAAGRRCSLNLLHAVIYQIHIGNDLFKTVKRQH